MSHSLLNGTVILGKLRVNEGVGTLCTMYVQYKAEGVSTALEELIGM